MLAELVRFKHQTSAPSATLDLTAVHFYQSAASESPFSAHEPNLVQSFRSAAETCPEHKMSQWRWRVCCYFWFRFWQVASCADPWCTSVPNFSTVKQTMHEWATASYRFSSVHFQEPLHPDPCQSSEDRTVLKWRVHNRNLAFFRLSTCCSISKRWRLKGIWVKTRGQFSDFSPTAKPRKGVGKMSEWHFY